MSVPIPGVSIPLEEQDAAYAQPKWELKELKPWHKNLASMVAQGIDRQTVAVCMDCTPEYVSMLARQPKVIEYMRALSDYANLQLESYYEKSVTAIGEVLVNGNAKEKIQAARLQMEATKRIGPRTSDTPAAEQTIDRLSRLAERLLYLQGGNAGSQEPILDGEIVNETEHGETGIEETQCEGSGQVRDEGRSDQSA
jgi:hypothetical protein